MSDIQEAHNIKPGDRIQTNMGAAKVLDVSTVKNTRIVRARIEIEKSGRKGYVELKGNEGERPVGVLLESYELMVTTAEVSS